MHIPCATLFVATLVFAESVVGLGAAAAAAQAKPRPRPLSRRAVARTHTAFTSTGQVATGPLAKAKALLKFNKALPSSLAKIVSSVKYLPVSSRAVLWRAGGQTIGNETVVSNTPEIYDTAWIVPVEIGTPPQLLELDFDTGSSDLWVFSTYTAEADVGGQSLYNPDNSSTATLMPNAIWAIHYADTTGANGFVVNDNVTIGGLSFTEQAVEVAEAVSSEFTMDSSSDGLLGFAFGSLNTVTPNKQNTFFENVQSNLEEQCFAVDLKHNGTGSYFFGYCDVYAPPSAYGFADVNNSSGFWGFTPTVEGNKLSNSIADTGTTLLLIDDSGSGGLVTKYWQQVQGSSIDNDAGGWVFPCSAELPDFSFQVGPSAQLQGQPWSQGSNITIPGDYMNYAPYSTQDNTCYGGLQDSECDLNVFGDVALKPAYVVFDYGRMLLWWAQKDVS